MTEEQLLELERLHRAATPGGWHTGRSDVTWFNGSGVECVAIYHDTTPDGMHLGRDLPLRLVVCEAGDTGIANPRNNAASIAANHNAMDYLISAARREKVLREAMEKIVRTPSMPFPDPGAHSAMAWGSAVKRAWNDIQHIAIAALKAEGAKE